MPDLLIPFELPFMQRAALEMLLLAISGGLLGSWIVLRRLAFFTHAVGTATFPGLAFAGAVGLSPQLAALATSLAFTTGVERSKNRQSSSYDVGTALTLVAMLALGVVLASDIYRSGAAIDRLLFGSLLGLGSSDILWSLGTAILTVAVSLVCFRSWLLTGFDHTVATTLGTNARRVDLVLLFTTAVAVISSLSAVGSLLVSAIFVLPAATVALFSRSLKTLIFGAILLAAVEGVCSLTFAYYVDLPPGPAVAIIAGTVFVASAAVKQLTEKFSG